MDKIKTGSKPAPGAESLPVGHYREIIQDDLKIARVMMYLVWKDEKVASALSDAIQERMRLPNLTACRVQQDAERIFSFLTYATETSVLLDSVADVTQGLAENLKQAQSNASMASPGDNSRG